MRDILIRLGIVGELFQFLWRRKLYWLIPMVIALAVFALLIMLTSNPGTAPWIYSLF